MDDKDSDGAQVDQNPSKVDKKDMPFVAILGSTAQAIQDQFEDATRSEDEKQDGRDQGEESGKDPEADDASSEEIRSSSKKTSKTLRKTPSKKARTSAKEPRGMTAKASEAKVIWCPTLGHPPRQGARRGCQKDERTEQPAGR